MDEEEDEGFFSRPVPKSLLVFGGFVVAYLGLLGVNFAATYLWGWGPESDRLAPFYDLLLCGGGLVVWGIFFAQFVLPVHKMEGRIKIVQRLITYISGSHGPAIFIENGVIRAKEGGNHETRPGRAVVG